jgi:hypothetical protein
VDSGGLSVQQATDLDREAAAFCATVLGRLVTLYKIIV